MIFLVVVKMNLMMILAMMVMVVLAMMVLVVKRSMTSTWSAHQYQILDKVIPVIRPDQGRSPAPTSTGLNMCRKSS